MRIKEQKTPNLTRVEKKKVLKIGEPSYTSGVHTWKGGIDNLKKKLNSIKNKPRVNVKSEDKLIFSNVKISATSK